VGEGNILKLKDGRTTWWLGSKYIKTKIVLLNDALVYPWLVVMFLQRCRINQWQLVRYKFLVFKVAKYYYYLIANLQIKDELWYYALFHQSNSTTTPSSSSKPCSKSTIVTRNLCKFFQLRTANFIIMKKKNINFMCWKRKLNFKRLFFTFLFVKFTSQTRSCKENPSRENPLIDSAHNFQKNN